MEYIVGKSEGTVVTTKTHQAWVSTARVFKQKRTIWLAAMLAFFAPSMAAAAWYAGSVSADTITTGNNTAGFSQGNASVNSNDSSQADTNEAGSAGTSASASVSTDENGEVKTEVVINGEKIDIPNNGSVQTTTQNDDGSTSNVSVSVNSSQNNSASSTGFSSTHLNTFTNSNSQNSNSTTSFNSNIHSSTP